MAKWVVSIVLALMIPILFISPVATADTTYNCRTPAYAKAHEDECTASGTPFLLGGGQPTGGGGGGGILGRLLGGLGLGGIL